MFPKDIWAAMTRRGEIRDWTGTIKKSHILFFNSAGKQLPLYTCLRNETSKDRYKVPDFKEFCLLLKVFNRIFAGYMEEGYFNTGFVT